MNTRLLEFFLSIQGEGLFIGYPQIFIRFANCNFNCAYCDTLKRDSDNFTFFKSPTETELIPNPVNTEVLLNCINYFNDIDYHSISLTGNEPLLSADFLKTFLPEIKNKNIFLETNGSLPNELSKIIDYINIISMDFKFNSVSYMNIDYSVYNEFIDIARRKMLYIKLVVSNDLTDADIDKFISLNLPAHLPVVIQPLTGSQNKISIKQTRLMDIYFKLKKYFNDCRIIPQSHKFMNLL